MWRELNEETGLGPGDVTLVGEHPDWVPYEWPLEIRAGRKGIGQVQRWFTFRVVDEHVVPQPDGTEFTAWRWVDRQWLVDNVGCLPGARPTGGCCCSDRPDTVRRCRRRAAAASGAARRPAPAADDRRRRRSGPPARSGQAVAPTGGDRHDVVGPALGSAGHRQDDAGPRRRRHDGEGVRAAVGGHGGRQGRPRGDRARPPTSRRARSRHDPVPRRDPPLQQGAAGRLAAGRRGRHADADRGDDGEPVLRGQPAAAQPLDAVPPRAARPRQPAHPRPARPATPCRRRRPTRRSSCSSSGRAATAARC